MENNTIFVGSKPVMNYVLAVVTQFNEGAFFLELEEKRLVVLLMLLKLLGIGLFLIPTLQILKFPQKKLKTTTKKRQMFQ